MAIKNVGPLIIASLLLVPAEIATANDSAVELAVGGMTFTRSQDVSVEEEALTITPETVTVLYRFLIQTKAPVTLTVGFPLPELSEQDVLYAIPSSDPVNFVDFKTKVDGKAIRFDVVQKARLGAKDVTAAIRGAGLPILLFGGDVQARIAALTPELRDRLINEGLLVPTGSNEKGEQIFGPAWSVMTYFTRKQVFPAGQTVTVEHHYKTSLGASQDTILRKALRNSDGMAEMLDRYRKDYCLPQDFLGGLDKLAGGDPANSAGMQERRIEYVLRVCAQNRRELGRADQEFPSRRRQGPGGSAGQLLLR
jgi:Domain of unknown function (DUF4424)